MKQQKQLGGGGGLIVMHGRSRMGMDPRMPTMPGRSTSGIHRSGRYCLQLSLGEGNKPKKGIYTFLESDGVQRTLQALKKLCTHSSTFLFAPSKPKPRKIKIIQVCIPFRSVTAPADARVRKNKRGYSYSFSSTFFVCAVQSKIPENMYIYMYLVYIIHTFWERYGIRRTLQSGKQEKGARTGTAVPWYLFLAPSKSETRIRS